MLDPDSGLLAVVKNPFATYALFFAFTSHFDFDQPYGLPFSIPIRNRALLSRRMVDTRADKRRARLGNSPASREARRSHSLQTQRAWPSLQFRADAFCVSR
jgi:hypothetical protein